YYSITFLAAGLYFLLAGAAAQLLALLHDVHAQGTTVILVASEEISQIGTRLWRLDGGRLLYDERKL
ncbi:MAG: hypothetical protein K6T71_07640, partial [Candidatus Bipolaricaulota bacterium]|nr:hypothetical protein [Candidatus Bipolaricaulota bacterium]